MKTMSVMCVALLAVCFLAGCRDDSTPVNPPQSVAFDGVEAVSGPPAQSGPYVVRFDDVYALWFIDVERNLGVIIGDDIVEFCSSGIPDFEIVSIMDVNLPNDQAAVIDIMWGQHMTASVWPFTTFNCDLFLNTPPLATGYVNFRYTDNDLYAWMHEDPKRMNSYGITANGLVKTPDFYHGALTVRARILFQAPDNYYLDNSQIHYVRTRSGH